MRAPATDSRLHSPAAERNRGPILDALRDWLPEGGTALEVAAGTGQHAAWFGAHLPDWAWWPTDPSSDALASIAAWCAGSPNVHAPRRLDVLDAAAWDGLPAPVELVYCANMVHIAPWACCGALMRGAAPRLAPGGQLVLYGPFVVEGEPLAPGNAAFDADLRARDPAWGLRRLGAVVAEAAAAGLALRERRNLPANNLLLRFTRQALPGTTTAAP